LSTSKAITSLSTRFAVVVTFSLPPLLSLMGVMLMPEAFKVEAISTFFSNSTFAVVVFCRSVVSVSFSCVKVVFSVFRVSFS
jgi:hypothetical protein